MESLGLISSTRRVRRPVTPSQTTRLSCDTRTLRRAGRSQGRAPQHLAHGARRGPRDTRKTRTQLHLALTPAEIRRLERWAESEIRSVSNLVSYLLAEHLRTRRRPGPVQASPGKRRDYSAQVWLTAKQRQELNRRAKAEMRTPGNYCTAVVLGALGEG